MQKLETSLLKSMIPIVQMSDKLLELKFNSKSASESDVSEFLQLSLDSLALMGHSINEVNIKRRELIKPDLNDQFKQLCGSHTPVTKLLFGDDLPKSVKEISETKSGRQGFVKTTNTLQQTAEKIKLFSLPTPSESEAFFYGNIKGQGRDHTWTSNRRANQINTKFCQTARPPTFSGESY